MYTIIDMYVYMRDNQVSACSFFFTFFFNLAYKEYKLLIP